MATEAQLLDALRRADAAGDTAAAQAIARRIQETRTQGYIRPEVDPRTENMDPRDVQSQQRPGPARDFRGIMREVFQVGPLGGVVRGFRDPVDAGAELLVRGANAVGLASDADVRSVDDMNRAANQRYLDATGRQAGALDGARLAGNVAAATAVIPSRLMSAPTLAGRVRAGATVGAIGGAMQPVMGEGDFASTKTKQVAGGALAGAVATPVVEGLVRAAVPVVNTAADLIRRAGASIRPQQADNLISQALEANGLRWSDLADDARQALRQDVQAALRTGGQVDAEAVRRLADIRAVGATPTRGAVTLDPVQVSAEKNLARIGANSSDPQLQRLARLENENNAALIQRINQLQGTSQADEFSTGARLIRELQARDEQAANTVRGLYDRARSLNGGEIQLDGAQFVNNASRALDAELKGAFLPAEFRTILQRIQAGKIPMNVGTAEQLRTMLASASRGAQDGNVRRALSLVRDALEGTSPVQSASTAVGAAITGGQGAAASADDVTQAFARARAAHAARMQMREESPALAAALDGAEPDKFVQQFVIGSGAKANVADVNALRRAVQGSPETLEAVRGQIVAHLKNRALSGASDEIGAFSQSNYNKALNAIGDRKLNIFFSPEEIAQLRQLGRAASYLQTQPKGSAVNNSNSANAFVGLLDRLVSRIPFGDAAIRTPLNNLSQQRDVRNALLQPLPVDVAPLVDDATRNALLRLTGPAGGAFGVASAQ